MPSENPTHRFGRSARTFDPRVPHFSALVAGKALPAPPASVNNIQGMDPNFGMMLNDNLGDCTCAAFYHALQVWTFNAAKNENTAPDNDVRQLYEEACGYNPNAPGPGPGGNEQHVLTFLLQRGAPLGPTGQQRQRISAFVEVDHRNIDDVKSTIFDCGVAYIGFPVPENIDYNNPVWDYDPKIPMTNEGHAVILAGYDANAATVISWGRTYKMTWPFVANIVDEVYAIADRAWIETTKKNPAGLTLAQLEAQMQALKAPQSLGATG